MACLLGHSVVGIAAMKPIHPLDRTPWPTSRFALRHTARAWFQEETLRRLVRNVGYLAGGDATAYPLDLIALALTARVLGPEQFGVMVLIQAYARTVNRLLTFQSWQAIIRFGSGALEQRRSGDFLSLIKFGLLLDIGTGITGCIVGLLGLQLAGRWFDWSHETVMMASVSCLALAFSVGDTPTAILRLSNRFNVLAYRQVATSVVRVILALGGFLAGAGLWFFVLVAIFVQIFGHALVLTAAWRELRRQGLAGVLRAPLKGVTQRFPDIWHFAWSTNITSTLRMSTQEVDTLVVGGLVDATAAGLYHVAKRMVRVALQLALSVQQAVYPDVAKLWAKGATQQFGTIVQRANLLMGMMGCCALLVTIVGAQQIIVWSVGAEFRDASVLLIIQMLAGTIILFGIALQPALMSMGLQRRVLQITFGATALFHVLLLTSVPWSGPLGASLAHVAFSAVWVAAMLLTMQDALKRHEREATRGGVV
jgi:O-antigen/teichoic acid export membrane protein